MRPLPSAVTAVTVYRRGAIVVREATLVADAAGWPAQVQLDGLPLTLDDASVQVEVVGSGDAPPPVARDVRITVAVPPDDPTLPPPDDDELEAARLRLAIATRTLEEHEQARARIDALQPARRGEPEEGKPPAPSPTAARLELLGLRRRRADAAQARIAAARLDVHEARERFETLQERRRIASDHRNPRTWEIRKAAVIGLQSQGSTGGSATLRLRYYVGGARWAPAYTLRLASTMDAGTLELRAVVGQATGEDWRDVALTLSTATPQQWTELPELPAMRIGRAQPSVRKTGWRPAPVGADALYTDYDRALPPRPVARAAPVRRARLASETREAAFDAAPADAAKATSGGAPPAPPPPMEAQVESMPTRGFAASMPPPAPVAAPAPMSVGAPMPPAGMPQTLARKRSGGIGGMLGAAADGMAAAFGPRDDSGGGGPSFDAPAEPLDDPGIVAGRDLLDYGRLFVPPASDTRRGVLRRIQTRTLYREVLEDRVELDVAFERIGHAQASANALELQAPPPGHRWPQTDEGFDYAYVADARVDIPSDPGLTSIPVLMREAPASPRFVSVPRESQDVFRVVALGNPLQAPLLPGPADVYVGGKFTLTSDVELTPTDGRIELGLGVEQAIKIARNVEFTEDTAGLIKKHQELSHRIRIEVHNHLPRAAVVEIRERLPIAAEDQADDISIEVERVEPPWDEYEREDPPLRGGRAWKVQVPAGGEQRLVAHWVVKIPGQHEVLGGNRRES